MSPIPITTRIIHNHEFSIVNGAGKLGNAEPIPTPINNIPI